MMEPKKFQLNQHTVKLSLNGVDEKYIVFHDKRTKEIKRPILVYIKKNHKYCFNGFTAF